MKYLHYDKIADTLSIIIDLNNPPAISVDYGGEYWLRIDPATNKIIGLEIEAFAEKIAELGHSI